MKPEELKEKLENLSIWKKNGQRAPHKPLLILYALGQYLDGKTKFSYEEVRGKLKNLLTEFGPARKSYHPEEPFVRLAGDGIWELDTAVDKRNPNDKKLLEDGVTGSFNSDVILLLNNNRTLVMELAMQVLEEHFPAPHIFNGIRPAGRIGKRMGLLSVRFIINFLTVGYLRFLLVKKSLSPSTLTVRKA